MNIAIILSGGIGARMHQSCPKQYSLINHKPVIDYAINNFRRNSNIDAFIIVLDDTWKDFFIKKVAFKVRQPVFYACPGENRQHSIYNALRIAVQHFSDNDIVIIHDAARPLVTGHLIDDCINACAEFDGSLPVLPMKDTVYLSEDSIHLSGLLERDKLYAGQAPEAFRLGKYWKAHEIMSYHEILSVNGSTEIAYKAGLNIKLIAGDEMNFKITTPVDLEKFKQIIEGNEG